MIGQILGGVQAAIGIGQTIAGLVKKKPEIPDYEIPQEVWENMTDAEYMAMEGLPPAQKQQFIEQAQRAGATALSRSTSRKGGLGLVSSIAQQETDAATQLLSMDAAQRLQNMQSLYRAREVVAGEKRTAHDYATQKVMQERAEVDELRGAGLQNIMGAAGTMAGIDALGDGEEGGGIMGWLSGLKEKRIDKKVAKGVSPVSIPQSKSYSPSPKREDNLMAFLSR